MKTGEIFYWTTDKAKGHESRPKYHIFICPADWHEDNTFLFICSIHYFNDFKITQDDWKEMPKTASFIGCSSPVFYSDSELNGYSISLAGKLTVESMKRLAHHVQNSETFELHHIRRILAALHSACK